MLSGYLAYNGGQSFFHFLHKAGGDSLFTSLLKRCKKIKNPYLAIENTYNAKIETLGKEWHQQLKRNYWPEIGIRIRPEDIAKPVTKKEKNYFSL